MNNTDNEIIVILHDVGEGYFVEVPIKHPNMNEDKSNLAVPQVVKQPVLSDSEIH